MATAHARIQNQAPTQDRPAEAFEQLDSALRVISPGNWFSLSVVFGTLGVFLLFSCLYKAPLKVEGRGIILARSVGEDDSLLQVTAPAAGRLAMVDVKIGHRVKKGQSLGVIDQGELLDQIRRAETLIKGLELENVKLNKLDEIGARAKTEALDRLEATLKETLALDLSRLRVHRELAEADLILKNRKFLTRSDALKTKAESDAVQSAIGATQAKLDEVAFNRVDDKNRRDSDRVKREIAIDNAKEELRVLQDRHKRDTQIVSPHDLDGEVVDLMITPHALVEKGAPVALLRPWSGKDRSLEAVVFVPAGMGKKIHKNDKVEVSPDTVRRHEHGYIKGVVKQVSEIPATEMAMLAELKHKSLVSSFVERYPGQVLLCIHVELFKNPDAALPPLGDDKNDLEWSSSSGSSQPLGNGTLCAADIVVERRRLIWLAMPWVKDLVGAE